MTINNTSTCPDCGGVLKYYDKVSRLVREKGGEKRWIKLRRFRCTICYRLHRELPEYILPYKHYTAEIINGVLYGSITSDVMDYEDYPCEMTIKRWTQNS